jgi:hypothetical protein
MGKPPVAARLPVRLGPFQPAVGSPATQRSSQAQRGRLFLKASLAGAARADASEIVAPALQNMRTHGFFPGPDQYGIATVRIDQSFLITLSIKL